VEASWKRQEVILSDDEGRILFSHVSVRVVGAMVEVGVVRVPVHQQGGAMSMRVWLARGIEWPVLVPVVLVVDVPVFMLDGLVLVLVRLGEMQVQAECQRSSHDLGSARQGPRQASGHGPVARRQPEGRRTHRRRVGQQPQGAADRLQARLGATPRRRAGASISGRGRLPSNI
jgi:hypothetical protein